MKNLLEGIVDLDWTGVDEARSNFIETACSNRDILIEALNNMDKGINTVNKNEKEFEEMNALLDGMLD